MGEAEAGTCRQTAEREAAATASSAQRERGPRNIEDTSESQRQRVRFAHRADFVDVAFRLVYRFRSSHQPLLRTSQSKETRTYLKIAKRSRSAINVG